MSQPLLNISAQLGHQREKSQAPDSSKIPNIDEKMQELFTTFLQNNSGTLETKSRRRTPRGVPPSLVAAMKAKCKVDPEVETLLELSFQNPAAIFEYSTAASGTGVRNLHDLYQFGMGLNKQSNPFVRVMFCVVITDGNDIANPRQRNTGLVGVNKLATFFENVLGTTPQEQGQESTGHKKILKNVHNWVTTGTGYRKLAGELSEGSLAILPTIMPGDQMATKQLRLSRHHNESIASLKAWGIIEQAEAIDAGKSIKRIREFYRNIFDAHRYTRRRPSTLAAQPQPRTRPWEGGSMVAETQTLQAHSPIHEGPWTSLENINPVEHPSQFPQVPFLAPPEFLQSAGTVHPNSYITFSASPRTMARSELYAEEDEDLRRMAMQEGTSSWYGLGTTYPLFTAGYPNQADRQHIHDHWNDVTDQDTGGNWFKYPSTPGPGFYDSFLDG